MCDSHVQGFKFAAHRNLHRFVGKFDEVRVRASTFVTHEERHLAELVLRNLAEGLLGMQIRCDDGVTLAAQEVDLVHEIHVEFKRNAEERARGTAHNLRVERAHGTTTENHARRIETG